MTGMLDLDRPLTGTPASGLSVWLESPHSMEAVFCEEVSQQEASGEDMQQNQAKLHVSLWPSLTSHIATLCHTSLFRFKGREQKLPLSMRRVSRNLEAFFKNCHSFNISKCFLNKEWEIILWGCLSRVSGSGTPRLLLAKASFPTVLYLLEPEHFRETEITWQLQFIILPPFLFCTWSQALYVNIYIWIYLFPFTLFQKRSADACKNLYRIIIWFKYINRSRNQGEGKERLKQ